MQIPRASRRVPTCRYKGSDFCLPYTYTPRTDRFWPSPSRMASFLELSSFPHSKAPLSGIHALWDGWPLGLPQDLRKKAWSLAPGPSRQGAGTKEIASFVVRFYLYSSGEAQSWRYRPRTCINRHFPVWP